MVYFELDALTAFLNFSGLSDRNTTWAQYASSNGGTGVNRLRPELEKSLDTKHRNKEHDPSTPKCCRGSCFFGSDLGRSREHSAQVNGPDQCILRLTEAARVKARPREISFSKQQQSHVSQAGLMSHKRVPSNLFMQHVHEMVSSLYFFRVITAYSIFNARPISRRLTDFHQLYLVVY